MTQQKQTEVQQALFYADVSELMEMRGLSDAVAIGALIHTAVALADDMAPTKLQLGYMREAMQQELDRAFVKVGKARVAADGRVTVIERIRRRLFMRWGLRWRT